MNEEQNCRNCGAPAEPVCSYCKTPTFQAMVDASTIDDAEPKYLLAWPARSYFMPQPQPERR